MSVIQAAGAGETSSGFYSHSIGQSLRFEDGDNPYLSKTLSGSGGTIFTFSCWIKLGNLSINRQLLQGYSDGNNFAQILLYSGNYIGMYSATSGTARLFAYTQALQRDPSAWYNIVVKFNGTSGSEEFKIYVNGENQTLTTSTSLSAHQSNIGNSNAHYVGNNFNQSQDMDGYMAEVNFIDGTALDADSFGETKAGIWIPKETSGLTFGTNGFRLKFQDSSALGDDTSGNGNDFSSSGLASTDVVLDSPTNNWCVINPLDTATNTPVFSEGNLAFRAASSQYANANGTMAFNSNTSEGFYFEQRYGSSRSGHIGIYQPNFPLSDYYHLTGGGKSYILYPRGSGGGNTYWIGSETGSGFTQSNTSVSHASGDIIGVAVKNNKIYFSVNGTYVLSGDPVNETNPAFTVTESEYLPTVSYYGTTAGYVMNFGQDSSFAGLETPQGNAGGNGIGDFYYAPPSGYLALCSANFSDPEIDPAQGEEPADHFNTVLYTGDGSGSQAITGVGFQPDWVWAKARSIAYGHRLFDSVRGVSKRLQSNSTGAEATENGVTSFDSDGFTAGHAGTNGSGQTFAAWNWLGGGTANSNGDGSITSSVSANTKAGFSVLTYTGTGSTATVGHGLNSAPDFIIVKSRDNSRNWRIYNSISGATKYLGLNSSNAEADSDAFWNDTDPTSSVFTVKTATTVNGSSEDYVAYCFQNLDGYSKVGRYTGNGSTDGAFVYTGFRPAWLMIKSYDQTRNWTIFDNKRTPFNLMDGHLHANADVAEQTGDDEIDFLSNGFKFRSGDADSNYSNFNYIYLAFAKQPFKYSNAR